MPLGALFRERYGAPYRTIHRADLLQLLSDAAANNKLIEIATQSSVHSFAAILDGVAVSIRRDGTEEELTADGLIGADGVSSAVRAGIPGASAAISTGRIPRTAARCSWPSPRWTGAPMP